MREYTVTKEILNIRSKASDEFDETYVGSLLFGDTVWLDEKEIIGTIPKGGETNIWLPDTKNNVVSKDGVRLKNYEDKKTEFINDPFNLPYLDPNDKQNKEKWKVSWGHVDLEIWKIWRDYNTMGEGVKVAVIDTGVLSDKNDLKGRISNLSCSVIGNDIIDISDSHHGTMSAGLIGASSETVRTIIGIAPKCELIIIKAGGNGFIPINLLKALNKAVELKAHIISISIESYDPTYQQDPQTLIDLKKLIQNNKDSGPIFIAAVGDNGDESVSYPASIDACFSVGAYSLDENDVRVLNENNNRNKFLSFLCPGNHITTCSPTEMPSFYDASSAATAFASGIFALILSKVNNEKRNYSYLSSIISSQSFTEKLFEETMPSIKQGYGLLSPLKLINFLNTQ